MALAIAISGACGRMGLAIGAQAFRSPRFRIVAALTASSDPLLGKPYPVDSRVTVSRDWNGKADVLVDFSTPEGTQQRIAECVRHCVPVVVGTTGFSPVQERALERAAKRVACVRSGNMSVGVNALMRFLPSLASALGADFDCDLVETHHTAKKDAPSGTAKMLAARLGRPARIHSIRSGDEVGEHRVLFGGPGERIEVTHRATSRDVFARGALVAAEFAAKAEPGLYSMMDVIAGRKKSGGK